MSTPPEPLRPSDPAELGGYRLIGRLGEGGQGTVYLGEGASGDRVAVKTLTEEATADPGMRKRFAREAEAARQVASFCTAAVVAADVNARPPYIASEYVAGRTLHRRVRDVGPMDAGDLDRLAVATATALVAIHDAGIVHRDLKPGNVILGEGGIRVIDFGIAQVTTGAGTLTDSTIGTPAFMAPEQIADGRATPSSDVFAWGALIAFAATGASPFDGPTVPNVLHRVINDEPDLSGVPEPLRALVAAALAKDPAARPESGALLMSLLGRDGGRREAATRVPADGPAPGPVAGPKAGPRAGASNPLVKKAGVLSASVLALLVLIGLMPWVERNWPENRTSGGTTADEDARASPEDPPPPGFFEAADGSWEGRLTTGKDMLITVDEDTREARFEVDGSQKCAGEILARDLEHQSGSSVTYRVVLRLDSDDLALSNCITFGGPWDPAEVNAVVNGDELWLHLYRDEGDPAPKEILDFGFA